MGGEDICRGANNTMTITTMMKNIKHILKKGDLKDAHKGINLDTLVHNSNPKVRAAVAQHHKDEHLDILAHDDNPKVIHHVLMALREKDIAIALESPNPTIRGMAGVVAPTIEQKVSIAHDPHYKARIMLAHPDSPVLGILARDEDYRVRAAVASFHSEYLGTLTQDPSIIVSNTAMDTRDAPIAAQMGAFRHH